MATQLERNGGRIQRKGKRIEVLTAKEVIKKKDRDQRIFEAKISLLAISIITLVAYVFLK